MNIAAGASEAKDEPQDEDLDETVEILERADAKRSGVPLFSAHWHLFVPTTVIAILYAAMWIVLVAVGKIDSNLARMFVIVMAVGVPLLTAHAFLRYQTIRLQVNENNVLCHPGWPKDQPVEITPDLISSIVVKRGLSGLVFGGGTLVMSLTTGSKMVIADLDKPEEAKAAIEALQA